MNKLKAQYLWHKYGAITTLIISILGFALLAGYSKQAEAQPSPFPRSTAEIDVYCGYTQDVYKHLKEAWGEEPVVGAMNIASALVWFTNESRSTMTIVTDRPDGISCIIHTGVCPEGMCFMTDF